MPTTFRRVSLFLFIATLILWIVTALIHYIGQRPNLRDWGQFGIYCLIPILLLLNRDRRELVTFVARLCVMMALADLAFNILVILGLISPVVTATFSYNGVDLNRYPGISGGVLSGGEVALVAIVYSAWRTRCKPETIPRWGWFAILALCFWGIYLIDARRYLVAALFGAAILLVRPAKWISLPLYAIAEAGFGIFVTFVSLKHDQVLRATLMVAAFEDMMKTFWLGNGPYYVTPVQGTTFVELWTGHVTESGALDVGLAFGVPAAILFFASVFIALLAKRASVSWMPVLLTVLTGQFAFSNPFSFLGSVVFFGALICIVLQEVSPRQAQRNTLLGAPALAMMPG